MSVVHVVDAGSVSVSIAISIRAGGVSVAAGHLGNARVIHDGAIAQAGRADDGGVYVRGLAVLGILCVGLHQLRRRGLDNAAAPAEIEKRSTNLSCLSLKQRHFKGRIN